MKSLQSAGKPQARVFTPYCGAKPTIGNERKAIEVVTGEAGKVVLALGLT